VSKETYYKGKKTYDTGKIDLLSLAYLRFLCVTSTVTLFSIAINVVAYVPARVCGCECVSECVCV
jgi:hypothetical protein